MRRIITSFAMCLCLAMATSSLQLKASMFDDLSKELRLTIQQQQDVKRILEAEAKKLLELKLRCFGKEKTVQADSTADA